MTTLTTSPASTSYAEGPALTRLQRVRWAGGPLGLTVGPAMTVLGFAFHPGGMSDRSFVEWTGQHADQFAVAHLLIGLGAILTAVGIWSVLRLVSGKRGIGLALGTVLTSLGMLGMGCEHLTHGAVGYALASSPQVPLGMSTAVQVHYETLPYVGWAGLLSMFFPLGVIALGIGALVSRRIPAWAAILLLLGPVGIMFAGVGPLEVLGAAPLMVGFAALARAAWKTRPLV